MVNRKDMQYKRKQDREDFEKEFDQMFPMPAQKREDVTKFIVEVYLNYKRSYVRQLLFSPDTPNLSEFIRFISSIPTETEDTILFQAKL